MGDIFTPSELRRIEVPTPKQDKDVYTLEEFRRIGGKQEVGNVENFANSIAKGFLDVGSGLVGTATFLGRKAVAPFSESAAVKLTEAGQSFQDPIEHAKEFFPTDTDTAIKLAGNIIGQTIPYLGAALVGGTFAGPVGAMSVGFSVEGENAYQSALATGATEVEAQRERVLVGSLNAAIEALQVGKILKFGKTGKHSASNFIKAARDKAVKKMMKEGVGFSKQVLEGSILEVMEEFAQEGVTLAVPAAMRDEYPKDEFGNPDWLEIGQRLGFSALAGGIAGGTFRTGLAGIQASAEAFAPSGIELNAVKSNIMNSSMTAVEKANHLRELDTIAKGIDTDDFDAFEGIDPEAVKTVNIAHQVEKDLRKMEAFRPLQKKEIEQERARRFSEADQVYEKEIRPGLSPDQQHIAAKSIMSGTMTRSFPPLKEKYSPIEINKLKQSVTSSNLEVAEKIRLMEALQSVFEDGRLPQPAQLQLFDDFFGTKTKDASDRARRKGWKKVLDALQAPRSILASTDVSAGGKQGFALAVRHPKKWIQAVRKGYRSLANEKYAKLIEVQHKTDPVFPLFKKAEIFYSSFDKISEREEVVSSEYANKIMGVRASSRAHSTVLNELRMSTLKNALERWDGLSGNTAALKSLGKVINNLTGRGDLKALEKYSNELNAALFAPRLTTGRLWSIGDLLGVSDVSKALVEIGKGGSLKGNVQKLYKSTFKSPARKVVAENLVSFTAAGLLLLGLLKILKDKAGMDELEFEEDPRSSDFGKVKIGNTRVDIWAGYSQIARTVARIITGQRKTISGRVVDQDAKETFARFLRSKLNPTAGMAVDIWTGETYLGDKVSLRPEFLEGYFFQHITPLFIQDVFDALAYQGLDGVSIAAPLAFHGIGAMTYEPSDKQREMEVKDHISNQFYGEDWNDLGPKAQDLLREQRPQIVFAEQATRLERDDYGFVGDVIQQQLNAGNKIQKSLDKEVQQVMDSLQISVGGFSRRIASDWDLSEERYKQYQEESKQLLSEILPQIIKSSMFKDLTPEARREILEKIIDRIKKSVRKGIVSDADISDLVSLQEKLEENR